MTVHLTTAASAAGAVEQPARHRSSQADNSKLSATGARGARRAELCGSDGQATLFFFFPHARTICFKPVLLQHWSHTAQRCERLPP